MDYDDWSRFFLLYFCHPCLLGCKIHIFPRCELEKGPRAVLATVCLCNCEGNYLMDKPSLKLGQYCAEVDRVGSIKQFLERASAHSPQSEPNQEGLRWTGSSRRETI